ncbi:glutathione S-transferase family protein [Guyparkeria sp.]|uniref:glutathione S-transferase family protein n=1 Tax=Guyparkeria sp. TaxID=2035736 RepID=UPI0039707E35
MSLLVEGKLYSDWFESESEGGEFVRKDSMFRHWITPDGSPGPTGEGGFPAEAGRYHLYVSYACPWAHRTLIFRAIKGLADLISVDVVHPHMLAEGWHFGDFPGATSDSQMGAHHLHQLYTRADPTVSGIVTVPVLWDKQRQTIVNNESSEIIRMFNSAFDDLTGNRDDYYPAELHEAIDEINTTVYENVNNGVYRAGFATAQDAYETAFDRMFETLDELEARLASQRYLVGGRITEADWRLFTTLVRFDAVYVGHFKCNRNRLIDFPNLWAFTRELYQWPGVAETVRLDHIKHHYYVSHDWINPTGIVPRGPTIDFDKPYHRDLHRDEREVLL